MGQYVKTWLSGRAQLKDVAEVAAIILGEIPRYEPFGSDPEIGSTKIDSKARGCRVFGVTHTGAFDPSAGFSIEIRAYIQVPFALHGTKKRELWYSSYDPEPSEGCLESVTSIYHRFMMTKSTALNIAVAVRLAQFFGGHVVPSDAEVLMWHFPEPKIVCPSGGEAWELWQQKKLNCKPLTQEEYDHGNKWAAYPRVY